MSLCSRICLQGEDTEDTCSLREKLGQQMEEGVLLKAVKEDGSLTRKRVALEQKIDKLEKGVSLLKEQV